MYLNISVSTINDMKTNKRRLATDLSMQDIAPWPAFRVGGSEPQRERGVNCHVTVASHQWALLVSCIPPIRAHRGIKFSAHPVTLSGLGYRSQHCDTRKKLNCGWTYAFKLHFSWPSFMSLAFLHDGHAVSAKRYLRREEYWVLLDAKDNAVNEFP